MRLRSIGALALISLTLLAGCDDKNTYDISFYAGDRYDASGKAEFNYDLFYRNDPKKGGPDPFIFDNTSRDGYYYIFSTIGLYHVSRSKDLMNWESLGSALNDACADPSKEVHNCFVSGWWAPEITYDETLGKYFFFCSAHAQQGDTQYMSNSYVGISDNAGGPYYIVDFSSENTAYNLDTGTIGAGSGNLHTIDKKRFPENFAKYVLMTPGTLNDAIKNSGLGVEELKYCRTIDYHPYVDPKDGKKYLYFVNENSVGGNFIIYGVEMENWLKPKWDTFKPVISAGYYTIQDALNKSFDIVDYEINCVNEGPAVIEHKGKYYMTFSNGAYTDSTYCLIQAVADSPMGPYRKLRREENAIFLSTQLQGNESVSSSGHHGFVTVEDKLYAVYHKHRSYAIGGTDRVAAIDELKWVTTTDIYGNELDVLVANGPTDTIQPRIEKYSDYKNLALNADVSLTSGTLEEYSDLSYVNDDFLSTYKVETPVTSMVGETTLKKKGTIKLTLNEPKKLKSVMVYNSKHEDQIFKSIDEINIEWIKEGTTYHSRMRNIPFNKEFYNEIEEFKIIDYVTPASSAYAEFEEIENVKSVSITISAASENSEGLVGISEIKLLGR